MEQENCGSISIAGAGILQEHTHGVSWKTVEE